MEKGIDQIITTFSDMDEYLKRKKKEEENRIKSEEIINLVERTGYEDHFPNNRSFGFRFRISLARALAFSPQIIFLDDPLKQMDSETKDEIFALIKKIAIEKNIKFLLACSNITEAALLSDKILIFNGKMDNLTSQIIDGKYENRRDELRNKILEILLKENLSNSSSFSI